MNVAHTEITGLSLFTGIGGLDLGVERALERLGYRWRPAAYVEREAYCCQALLERIESGDLPPAPIWTDVTTFDTRPFQAVDAVVGGFPCQDISVAGKRAGLDGARSGLWRAMHRIIRDTNPGLVFIENVPGIRRADILGTVIQDLAALGYVGRWTSLRAADVGAPHRRERVFLLAHAGRLREQRRRGSDEVRGPAADAEGEGHQRQRRGDTAGAGGEAVAQAGTLECFFSCLIGVGFLGTFSSSRGCSGIPLTKHA